MSSELPLILLPGMGADHRLFRAQKAAFSNVSTPVWIRPETRESLPCYARRLAASVDPGEPCFVGGCSLGGMIALEMARHLQARACFLISSIRTPKQLPLRWRMLRPVSLAATQPLRGAPSIARALQVVTRPLLPAEWTLLLEQLADSQGRFLQWAAWAVLTWRLEIPPSMPVVQIHGTRDWMLAHRLTQPDVLVEGGGHALPVSHPQAVNDFLRLQMERFTHG